MEKSEINKKMLYHHDWTLLHHSTIIFIVDSTSLLLLLEVLQVETMRMVLGEVWKLFGVSCITVQWSDQSAFRDCINVGALGSLARLTSTFDFGQTQPSSLSPAVLSALRSDVSCKLMKSCKFFFFCSQLYVTFYSLLSPRRASLELGLRYSNPFASFAGTFCAMATSRFLSLSDTFFKYHSSLKINFNVTSSINQ